MTDEEAIRETNEARAAILRDALDEAASILDAARSTIWSSIIIRVRFSRSGRTLADELGVPTEMLEAGAKGLAAIERRIAEIRSTLSVYAPADRTATTPDRDALLKMLVRLARKAILDGRPARTKPGDLVVEITRFDVDPDAIGWLVAHGRAPYEVTPPLHVGDCPMTNARTAARTSCVCEHHDDEPRDYIEGRDGERYTGPTREVWDVQPLSGRAGKDGGPMRWENADFVALPDAVAELASAAFPGARPR